MNKIILIVSGIILLLIVILTFVYFLMFGAPDNANQVFTNFGIGSGSQNQFEQVDEGISGNNETSGPAIPSRTLKQLTTKPVAGMLFLGTTTVLYAEQGTGHIFELSLETGTERQLSNMTFTRVREAIFSPDGTQVVLRYEEGGLTRNTLGTIENGSLTTSSLLSGAEEFAFDETSNEIMYLIETADGTEGRAYNITDKTNRVLFELSFGSLRAHFGDATYVYTKPAASLLGYSYRVAGGELIPVTEGRFGLMATPFEGGVVISEQSNGKLQSTAFTTGESTEVAIALFPEKCAPSAANLGDLVCGGAIARTGNTLPDNWYKGATTFADLIWEVDLSAGEATLIADPLQETGRALDIEKIVANGAGNQFLVLNKTNSTLWLLAPED